ncbi:methyl-accepting chemotaxis sensory transducer with Cache sensor [Ureibacillus xyleni]|uniref:Methyl-accepting chemotaxis sensory transducer with Cache sensor n=1 Tax=Ureibacillus xyleni TaxID=614648 RepID=A0A285TKD6_9BACL|nr:methyl-accepting chemotaxis protein [Ureibacillus xyleni]SOC22639.1 methyl-accepting chemotaxis sensory transducer with Cache sensor [Ureibacillus xyleni]
MSETKHQRKTSIRLKFTVILLLIAMLPLLVVSYFVQHNNSNILIEKEQAAMHNLVVSKAQSVDSWFTAQMSEMQISASSDNLKSLDPKRMVPYLQHLEERSEVFETMFVIDPKGIVIAHTKPDSIGSDYSDRSYVPNALNGQSVYSEVLISKATGNRIVVAATPIKDNNDQVIGILAGSANFEVLVNSYLKDSNEDSSNLILVDQQGIIQEAPMEEIIGLPVEEAEIGELETILPKSSIETGISSFQFEKEDFILTYAPISSVGYGLSIYTPEKIVLADSNSIKNTSLIIISITAIIIAFLSLVIVRSITKPMLTIVDGMEKIANGDLTAEKLIVKSNDEIGQLSNNFNVMVENIKQLVSEIKHASESVQASSEELSAISEESVQATEQISASIQTIASNSEAQTNFTEDAKEVVTNISNGITNISENIQNTNQLTDNAVEAATTGTSVIDLTINQMKTVEEKTSMASSTINELGKKSSEIDEIISVITSIADQTNLLALNAAIEAARAGEYGKGFAVVADEVRKLAEQSSLASGQISELIKEIQQEIKSSMAAMNEGYTAVNDGKTLVEKAGNEFEKIEQAVQNVSVHMHEILSESKLIKEASERMVEDIVHISEISLEASSNTQEIASASEQQTSSMEEIAASAETLAKMAEELNIATQNFKL